MADIILHHFVESLFAEKVRLILGYKQLGWKSVLVPIAPPRPDLIPMTGGYRRTPVLQIGADVYCDTAVMVEALERIAPEPSVYLPGKRGLIDMVAQWGDVHLFWTCIAYLYQTDALLIAFARKSPEAIETYKNDRNALLASRPLSGFAETRASLNLYLQRLEEMLSGGQPFLVADRPTLADFSCYHPLWCIRPFPPSGDILQGSPRVLAWMDRVKTIGHGQYTKLSSMEALNIARDASPAVISSMPSDLPGIELGEQVELMPSDYGLDPMRGELVMVAPNHIAVRHSNERAGTVVAHFPRIGYLIRKSDQAPQPVQPVQSGHGA